MNNQALEALAALASAAPASNTANTTRNDNNSSGCEMASTASTPELHTSASMVVGANSSNLDSSANLAAAAKLVASLQQSTTDQQSAQSTYQHPVAAASQFMNMGQTHFPNGATAMNGAPSTTTSPELVFLQQLQRTSDPQLAMVMQNIAYYQLLLQSQAQQQQPNLPAALATLLAMNQGGPTPTAGGHSMYTHSTQQLTESNNSNSNPILQRSGQQQQQQHHLSHAQEQLSHNQQQHAQTQQQHAQTQQQISHTKQQISHAKQQISHAKQQIAQAQQHHGHVMYGSNNTASTTTTSTTTTPAPATPVTAKMPPPSAAKSPVAIPSPKVTATEAVPPSSVPSHFPRTTVEVQIPQNQGSSSSLHSGGNGCPRESEDDGECDSSHADDKKEQKRAANRRSAQLSRKRKKQFIEELKDENDDLRRKEQILKSIPDLVVVFDSSGKLWFVSQSITRFIRFEAHELEGKSFWERLCPESVRLLKAAFMDSLAARESHTDTVPLGDGLWDLRLADKDGSLVSVTLNGVVHFAGERPECVCCIRPKESSSSLSLIASSTSREYQVEDDGVHTDSAGSSRRDGNVVSDISTAHSISVRSESRSGTTDHVAKAESAGANRGSSRGSAAMRIYDSGNSSPESESGSSDEMNVTN